VAETKVTRIGGLFRRIADFFDSAAEQNSKATESRTNTETELIALGLIFLGIIVIGTLKLGWSFFVYNFFFALFFAGGIRFIFLIAAQKQLKRDILTGLILLLSIPAAADRLIGIISFVCLAFLMFLARWFEGRSWYRSALALTMALLFCFSGYGAFSFVIEWRRSANLKIRGALKTDCNHANERKCSVLETDFSVPEFWVTRSRAESNLVRDLSAVIDLTVYTDTATENTIAHAAFSISGQNVLKELQNFLSLQKSFLKSRTQSGDAVTLQSLVRGADVELYAAPYLSEITPGYLAESANSTAIVLIHERRGVTWLFIVDGKEMASREFLLHRIISGFKDRL